VVDGRTVHHLKDIVIVKVFVQLLGDGSELLEVDHAILVFVEDTEDFLEAVLGLGLSDFRANDVQKLRELNWLVLVPERMDQRKDERVSLVKSQLIENLVDLSGINTAATVLVEDVKRLLQLVIIFSSEAVLP
jgi:hypothetical protein